MKLHYDPETDSLCIAFKVAASSETREVADGVNVDLDVDGAVVGPDIDAASTKLDLSSFETEALPLRTIKAA